jgi:hypothetical protein
MDLNPLSVYKQAVLAVPSIKYALAVAGVIAMAMVSYNMSSDDPKKAVVGFIFVLVGMYLLLIFASAVASGVVGAGPVIAIVWSVTILLIIFLTLSLSAFALGWPPRLAEFYGASPIGARVASDHGRDSAGSVAAARTVTSERQTFQIQEAAEDCGVERSSTPEFCLAPGATVVDWAGPAIASANCGSNISNVRRVEGKENCVAADVVLRGCGYDNILGIKNCRGRGWIGGSLVVNGQRRPAS